MPKLSIRSYRDRLAATLGRLHEDEEGIVSIEMVLVLCAAAVVLALAFKMLWGKDNEGLIAIHIESIISNITSLFTFS
jgi:hypothetical protein